MDVLYTVKTQQTYDEYKKYNDFLQKKTKKLGLFRTMLIIGYVLVSILMFYLEMYKFLTFFICFFALYIAYLFYYKWARGRNIKKSYESNKLGKDSVATIDFYEDHFMVTDEHNQGTVPYDKIYKIYESDTNFYIMMSKISGIGIVKDNCPDGLCEFIRKIKKTE
ncbi:MAG: YcxB family protein [Clostridia bacterium]|nr:YcxB family protein [Clostridia bacterium]